MGKGNRNKNGFFFFMEDFKNQQGRSFASTAEAATAASPHWQKLSSQQRQKYEQMAQRSKETKYKQTSLGENIELLLRERKEKEDREMAVKQDIDNIVRKGVNKKTIGGEYFFIMHVNEFCYWEREAKFFPAEIALGKFSLKEGILKEDVYSSLVQPGPLPLGYSAEVKIKAKETHQIPYPGDDNNMEEVLTFIISKLGDGDADTFPPIYVADENILVVENVLANMCRDYGYPNNFKIYSLEYLLFSLKNNLSKTGSKVWPTISVSKGLLQNDVYDYCIGIACEYHETVDMPVHCSRSRVIRFAYIVCDNCTADLDLPLISGRHVPRNALLYPECYARAASSSSTRTTQVSELYARSETASSSRQNEAASEDFDSNGVTTNEVDTWIRPRRTTKHKSSQSFSQRSDICSELSQSSTSSEYVPGRRPVSQSLANPGVRRPPNTTRGRGRGRGVLQAQRPL